MNVRHLTYQTQYHATSEPVSFSPHLFRLFPKADRYVVRAPARLSDQPRTRRSTTGAIFSTTRSPPAFTRRNPRCFQAGLQIELELTPRNAFGFLLEPHALDLPFRLHRRRKRTRSRLICRPSPRPCLPFWQPPAHAAADGRDARRLEQRSARSPRLRAARGRRGLRSGGNAAPRARRRAAISPCCSPRSPRGLGLAARLASGYLCEFGDARETRRRRAARLDGNLSPRRRLGGLRSDQRLPLQSSSHHRRGRLHAGGYLAHPRQLLSPHARARAT